MPKVTEEHVEARRRQILSAALTCFAREGFHRATMHDIFREAELSPGAVYSYFKGKDELIGAIVIEVSGFIGQTVQAFTEPTADGSLHTPGEALAEVIGRLLEFEMGTLDERAKVFPHMVGELQRNAQVKKAVETGLEQLRDGFKELGRAAQERGELDPGVDLEYFSRLPLAFIEGLFIQRSIYGSKLDVDAYARTAVAFLDKPPAK